ncbi:MAG: hypothetical protein J6S71_10495 [Clostridia bacterium]|nr:hypothetical protein [Clostridia bacterium]
MKRLFICLLALLMIAGCAPSVPNDVTTVKDEVTPEPAPMIEIGKDYVLIFSNDDTSYQAAYEFSKLFAKATGITLKMKKDSMVERSESAKEIVFGKTDREEYYNVDHDSLVSDAFVLVLQGERLFISAGTADGYDAAFAAFFKETLGIEDIENMEKQDNAVLSLPEGFNMITEPSAKLESDKTASGISYRVEGATGGAYNHYKFTEYLAYHFDTPVGSDFNGYSLTYSTDSYIKGEISYKVGNERYAEEFFLEPGEQMNFFSLCDSALKGGKGSSIISVKLMLIDSKEASFILEDIATESREMPASEVVYITDGKYKLGVKLSWGGGVSYLEDLADGDDSITNLLNDHDTGRLIQQSYYGTNSAPYVPAKYGENMWCYNPVQGGDQHNNRSKLVDFKIAEDGKSIWVKCQPLDWAQKNSRTPTYMENTYTIADGIIVVDNRFIDFSGYTHRNAHQELPAFYTISYLSDFVFYNGSNGWKGEELTVKKDLPFWAGNSDAYFNMKSKETWGAWVAPSGYGIGVYTPIAEILLAGRHAYNGSKDAHNNATNYVAPLITYKLKAFEAFEYSYYITTGSVDAIRSTFEKVK